MKIVKEQSQALAEKQASTKEGLKRSCEDFLSDLQLDLEKISGTVGVMAHLGNSRERGLADDICIDDFSNFLCLLEDQLKGLDKRILSVLRSEDHKHPK